MKAERVIHLGGVKEECPAEAGATSVLRTSRVGSAALVAPASASARTKVDRIGYLILLWVWSRSGPEFYLAWAELGTSSGLCRYLLRNFVGTEISASVAATAAERNNPWANSRSSTELAESI
jgi:hypothetical protein